MTPLYPLRFVPLLRRYLWGGRRLESALGKSLPPGSDYAESWEVVDHGPDQSVVMNGPLAGKFLGELVAHHGAELLGRHHPQSRFPLLFKFLDCQKELSVQVHPDDARAARLDPPDLGKTESWLVLEADPGSVVYAGLKRGFDRPALEREVARGTTELCLNRIEVQRGDCIFLPAGVVHALGSGLVIAEIQQSSDTTYRLFDWNRVGPDGKPRALHVAQAVEAIDYEYGPVSPQKPIPAAQPHIERLVQCDKFVLDRWRLDQTQVVGGDQRFHIVAVLQGSATVSHDPSGVPLARGQTCLVPATGGPHSLTPTTSEPVELLDMYLP